MDTHKPVSRQHEEDLHRHYAWPIYWGGEACMTTGYEAPLISATTAAMLAAEPEKKPTVAQVEADPHLRSMRYIIRYQVHARDGDIGHVKDFVLDDADWSIYQVIVDTGNWLPGRKVLVAAQCIDMVSWRESRIFVDITREAVEKGPEFHPE